MENKIKISKKETDIFIKEMIEDIKIQYKPRLLSQYILLLFYIVLFFKYQLFSLSELIIGIYYYNKNEIYDNEYIKKAKKDSIILIINGSFF